MALPPLPWEDLTDSREDRAELQEDSPDRRQDSQTGLTWQQEVRKEGGGEKQDLPYSYSPHIQSF